MDQYAFYTGILVLDGLSTMCSIVSIALVAWVWYKQPSSKESPSFNLSLYIALADFPQRLSDILTNPLTFKTNIITDPNYLRFVLWLTTFGAYWFIYLNAMIVLDLQLVFFHRLPRQARVRRWYPLIGTAIAFFLAFWYLILPNIHSTPSGATMWGNPTDIANKFNTVWTLLWYSAGVFYCIAVVVCVWIKVIRSQRRLRSAGGGEKNHLASRALIHNTRLIMAYPIVLVIVYVPFILASVFMIYADPAFAMRFFAAANVLYASQGLFSLVILLFHPVMLASYRTNTFSFQALLSRLNLGRDRSGVIHSGGVSSTSDGFASTDALKQPNFPQIKTMDMGPGATGYFDGALEAGIAAHHNSSNLEKGDMNGEFCAMTNDPTCL
ncbi:hypothetical protein IWQ60_002590 [Tieghemiomyces parasiticus]|uniref:G protein-coupled receptor n=1 Tax=Tieghemiomyces parasiticus TaxID=78921 RepID=A0A9W8AB06_9FUNG|nr:hypothetical protein IWQ60_002590 [Tieghemiomyces parasiticus]